MAAERMNGNKAIVRFYLLPEQAQASDLAQVVGRLLSRAEAEQQSVVVRCADHEQALWLDEMLWQYPQSALLPHYYLPHRAQEPYAERCRIVLLAAPERAPACQVLLDISAENHIDMPQGCQRVLDMVWAGNRTAARARYRHYQQWDWQPLVHPLR